MKLRTATYELYGTTRRCVATALGAMMLTIHSCSLADPRDLCCPDACAMVYSYKPYGTEAFKEYISSLRHYLFDSNGSYIAMLPPGNDMQYQPLNLPEGSYTMVTLGNASEASATNHQEIGHISGLTLSQKAGYAESSDILGNSDELYWGVRSFAIGADGLATEPDGRTRFNSKSKLTTYMNNIHCHLTVRVVWDNVPEYIGAYEMELDGVPAAYNLNPAKVAEADGFTVPESGDTAVHRLTVSMNGQELEGEFVTLRYTDETIPTLRLRYRGLQVGPAMDLRKAFRTWGWRPSLIHVQKYSIVVRLYGNGNAELTPFMEASVDDWINGGSFG